MNERNEFERVVERGRQIPGFMTDAQAALLWSGVGAAPKGSCVVEIGSHFGRSTALLGAGAASRGTTVYAIDPHTSGPYASASDEEGDRVHEAFHEHLRATGVDSVVTHLRERSQAGAAFEAITEPVGMLYVDGDHRYDRARDDLRGWGARVAPGGRVFVHDVYSSPYVTAAVMRTLLFSRRFRYVGRAGSLVEYRVEPLSPAETARNVVRQCAPMWWFARNILVKVALKRGRPAVARWLGHRQPGWPF